MAVYSRLRLTCQGERCVKRNLRCLPHSRPTTTLHQPPITPVPIDESSHRGAPLPDRRAWPIERPSPGRCASPLDHILRQRGGCNLLLARGTLSTPVDRPVF